jgi:hypothetical protein
MLQDQETAQEGVSLLTLERELDSLLIQPEGVYGKSICTNYGTILHVNESACTRGSAIPLAWMKIAVRVY